MSFWYWLNPVNWFRRRTPSIAAQTLPTTTTTELFTGDLHPVVDIEGIGPVYEQKLAGVGIVNTDQLLAHDATAIANAIDVPERTVTIWQHMAELALVKGIGPQYAEALARSGIGGIDALIDGTPEAIAARVNGYLDGLDVSVVGQRITARRIKTWQTNAAGMTRTTTTVTLGGDALPVTAKQAVKDAGTTAATNNAGATGTNNTGATNGATTDGVQTGRTTGTVTMRRKHITQDGWKLYERNGRFSFQKMTQADAKAEGFTPVYEIPEGYDIQDGSSKPVVKKA